MGSTGTGTWMAACAAAALGASCLPVRALPEADRAEALITGADEAGGREDPSAAFYLEVAERELGRARVLARVGDGEGARSWARRALADAELARMLAIELAVRGAAQRTEAQALALSRMLDGMP